MNERPRTIGPLEHVPEDLWRRAAGSSHRLLMLDYDGTLVPLQVNRNACMVPDRLGKLLQTIAAGDRTTVAIISGRPLIELNRYLEGLAVWRVGAHGWESRSPDGYYQLHSVAPRMQKILDEALWGARKLGWASLLEIKRGSIVLHTRGLSQERAAVVEAEIRARWGSLDPDGDIRLERIKGGLELRSKHWNKGQAVLGLAGRFPPGTFLAYLGDDATDEDAFEVLQSRGFGIQVGRSDPSSRAAGWLASPAEVETFLEHWLRTVEWDSHSKSPPL